MKLFAFIFSAIMANPMMTYLMMDKLSDGEDDSMMKMLLFSPGLMGQNPGQTEQFSSMLPFLLMDGDLDNSKVSYIHCMFFNFHFIFTFIQNL